MLPERLIFFVVCNRRTFKFEVQMILYRQYNCLSLLNQWWKCSTHICIFQGVGIENLSFLAFSWFTLSPGEKSDVIEKIFLCFTARVLLPALWQACYNGYLSPPPSLWCPVWLCLLYYRLLKLIVPITMFYCLKFL